MARRGVMTALQAALAGIGGAAGGYVQQEELKRKRRAEEEARTRQEMLDVVGLQERGFMSPEQLAQQKEQGARITGSVVQNALLSALSPRAGVLPPPTAQDVGVASQALATAGLAPQRIVTAGGQEMFRTETPQQEALRLERLKEERTRMGRFEEDRAAVDRAIRIAQEQGKLQQQFGEEKFKADNRRDYETFIALGGKGKYNPSVIYSDMIKRREAEFGLAGQRSLIEARTAATGAGAGAPSAAGAPGERGPLPSVLEAISFIDNLSEADIKKLSGRGVAYATAAPMTMASGAQGFTGAALGPLVSGMQYGVASELDRKYAEYASMVSRQVARLNEKGVLSNQDVNDYKTQTGFITGETTAGKMRKAQRLKEWAQWVANVEQGQQDAAKPPANPFR